MYKILSCLEGPSGYNSLSVSPISCLEKIGFGLLGLPWVPKRKIGSLLNREGKESRNKGKVIKQEKFSSKTEPSFSTATKTPSPASYPPTVADGDYMQSISTETPEWLNQKNGWNFWITTLLPHHQPIRRKSWLLKPSLPNISFKNAFLGRDG